MISARMLPRHDWFSFARAFAIGCVLVAVMTYPTVPKATSVGRVDTNDGRFSIWNVAWVDHALLTSPRHLLDANIFWPHTGTLAYSELNLVAGALGLPWYAVTRNPLAALNGAVATALLLTFVLTWGLARRLAGSDTGALVVATAFTFCPYITSKTAEVQLLMTFVFPLVAWAFHRFADRTSIGRAISVGAALAVAALACGYYGIFAGCMLGVLALMYAQPTRAYWTGLAIALATTAAGVYPVFRAFSLARAASGAPPVVHGADAAEWSSYISDYLASSSVAHAWWTPALHAWKPWQEVLFPGFGLLVLAGIGLAVLIRSSMSWRPLVAYTAIVILAFWASFGPSAGLYAWLNAALPGMSLMRAPARFGVLVAFGLSMLAAFGAARVTGRRAWLGVMLAFVVAAELSVKTAEWGWPSWPLRVSPPVSPAYRMLASLPRGVLVEFQFPYVSSNYHNHGTAMYWSTYHWQPMVNGYSDVIPPDFDRIALPINGFPDPESFAIMRERQVRYVLWHIDFYEGEPRAVIEARLERYKDSLRPLVRTSDTWLYEITKWPE